MYTAAKNSKMPQCFACIRGVWGFIDRVTGLTHLRKARHGLHESNTGRQLSPLPWILRILCRILVSLHTKARNPQEPGRGRLRPREAQLGAHEESHGRQDSARVAAHQRPRAGALRAGQGGRSRQRGAQGGRQRPGLPGADGDGERPVLVAQALPLALHGDVAQEPAGPPRLVRLPLQGQPGPEQMGPDCKGRAPYPDDRRDLPQLGAGAASPVI